MIYNESDVISVEMKKDHLLKAPIVLSARASGLTIIICI